MIKSIEQVAKKIGVERQNAGRSCFYCPVHPGINTALLIVIDDGGGQ